MKRYIVDATITLHERPDMGQFEVGHYEGDNLAKAIAAMAGAASDDEGKTVHEVVLRMLPLDVEGCSCGMADKGAPGHDDHGATDSTETLAAMRRAYNLLGDGNGEEWDRNPEYTRAVVEVTRDACGLGSIGRSDVLALIRQHGAR